MARELGRRSIQDCRHPVQIHIKHERRMEQKEPFRSLPGSRTGKFSSFSERLFRPEIPFLFDGSRGFHPGNPRSGILEYKVVSSCFTGVNSAFYKGFQQYFLTNRLIEAVRIRYKGDVQIARILEDRAPAGAASDDPDPHLLRGIQAALRLSILVSSDHDTVLIPPEKQAEHTPLCLPCKLLLDGQILLCISAVTLQNPDSAKASCSVFTRTVSILRDLFRIPKKTRFLPKTNLPDTFW